MKVVRLSALCTGHLYTREIFLVLISVKGITVLKKILIQLLFRLYSALLYNRRDLLACSAVTQPTAPPRALFNLLKPTGYVMHQEG